jgi:hypothetical protein
MIKEEEEEEEEKEEEENKKTVTVQIKNGVVYSSLFMKKKTPWPLVRERTIPTERSS